MKRKSQNQVENRKICEIKVWLNWKQSLYLRYKNRKDGRSLKFCMNISV